MDEFGIIENLVSKEEFAVLMRKISTQAGNALHFAEFLFIIEEISKRAYKKDESLPCTYDKVEKFYQDVLKIDDPASYRTLFMKLAEEERRRVQREQLAKASSMSAQDMLKECVKKGIEPPRKLNK